MGDSNAKPAVGDSIFFFLAGFAFRSPMSSASTPPLEASQEIENAILQRRLLRLDFWEFAI